MDRCKHCKTRALYTCQNCGKPVCRMCLTENYCKDCHTLLVTENYESGYSYKPSKPLKSMGKFLAPLFLLMLLMVTSVSAGDWHDAGKFHEDFDGVTTADWTGGVIGTAYKYNTTNGYEIDKNSNSESPDYPDYFNVTDSNVTGSQAFTLRFLHQIEYVVQQEYTFFGLHGENESTNAGFLLGPAVFAGGLPDPLSDVKIQIANSSAWNQYQVLATATGCSLSDGIWYAYELNLTENTPTNFTVSMAIYDVDFNSTRCFASTTTDISYIEKADWWTFGAKDGHGGGSPGYIIDEASLRYAEPAGPSDFNSSMYARDFDVIDFNLASDTYQTFANFTINVSVKSNFSLLSAFTAEKTTGALENEIYMQILLDGVVFDEHLVRTVSSIDNPGVAGVIPHIFEFNISEHNIALQARRTGNGNINFRDIDFVLLQGVNSQNTVLDVFGNESFNTTDVSEWKTLRNFSTPAGGDLIITSYTMTTNATANTSTRFSSIDTGDNSSTIPRTITNGENFTVGYSSLSWYYPHGENYSFEGYTSIQSQEINYSIVSFNLLDDSGYSVEGFNNQNSTTDGFTGVNISAGDRQIVNESFTLVEGDGIFVTASVSLAGTTDNDIDIYVNASVNGDCFSKKSRYFESNGNIGNMFLYFTCENLTATETYDFFLHVNSSSNFVLLDEVITGIPITLLDITALNVAPIAGEIITPANGSLHGTGINVNWSAFSDPNGDNVEYSVYIGTERVCFTNATDCVANTTQTGTYFLKVTGSDGTLNSSTQITIETDNADPFITITDPFAGGIWTDGNITGNCTDVEGHLDSVVINDSRFELSGNASDFMFVFNGSVSEENISFIVTCNDTLGNSVTAPGNVSVDVVIPEVSPLLNYTGLAVGYVHNWSENVTDDLNLFSLNVSCTGGSGYSFYAEDLNTTLFLFENSSGAINTNMDCVFITKDAHTMHSVRHIINPANTGVIGDTIVIKDWGMVEYVVNEGVLLESMILDYNKEDRIGIRIVSAETGGQPIDYVFIVRAKNKINHIQNSMFDGWFVIDDEYWVDFDTSAKSTTTVERLDDTSYKVTVNTRARSVGFNSIGVINTNSQTQLFRIAGAAVLDWSAAGIVCGEKYPDNEFVVDWTSQSLTDCVMRSNDYLYTTWDGNCTNDTVTFNIGRNLLVLNFTDSLGTNTEESCNIWVDKTDKDVGDFMWLLISIGLTALLVIIGLKFPVLMAMAGLSSFWVAWSLFSYSWVLGGIGFVVGVAFLMDAAFGK